ncbi:alpha/beta hydrolase [Actibacterium lipolyticum]|uniref:Fluoroacetate dehalogenase n=1 Tax=Actibacterium lipolyticum TaxID=1524263 RepID=A0A238KTX7_9RHOB|nr:alpha/beta hydrolase [Actibacterium lipolyticum]SMX46265.1 Fluoroacetate dehalogenase [Actibacterium lipolyticum]
MTSRIPGFTKSRVAVNGIHLSVHQAGVGAPLILLHGYPQNHMCWVKIAPELAKHFHVIVPDLRGYGESEAPKDTADHSAYSKREMATDIVALMDALGIEKAAILGHDRGGRVTYRLALDHPDRVTKIGIIEIVPTGDFWAAWNADLALKAYHWTFLAQPAPIPEHLIGADPVGYIDQTLQRWTLQKSLDCFTPDAIASYRRQANDPARIAAMCADYRAGATIDRQLDDADRAAGRTLACPLKFLWAESGFPAQTGDPAALWAHWAPVMEDASCVSGHFAMEENPDAVLATFLPYFRDARG